MDDKIMLKCSNATNKVLKQKEKIGTWGSKHAFYETSLALYGMTNIENHSTVN